MLPGHGHRAAEMSQMKDTSLTSAWTCPTGTCKWSLDNLAECEAGDTTCTITALVEPSSWAFPGTLVSFHLYFSKETAAELSYLSWLQPLDGPPSEEPL